MGKGENSIARKKNKQRRKKENAGGAATTAYIRSVIAAKRRRKDGKRRMCEGMCFTLPTPDNPFNETAAPEKKKRKSDTSSKSKVKKSNTEKADTNGEKRNFTAEKDGTSRKRKRSEKGSIGKVKDSLQNVDMSKANNTCYLIGSNQHGYGPDTVFTEEEVVKLSNLLGKIRSEKARSLKIEDTECVEDKWTSLFVNAVQRRENILGSMSCTSDVHQTALIASAAAAHILNNRGKDDSVNGAMVLIVVVTKAQAMKVRKLCKPLKECFGLHSVSLHSGTKIDHQVQGLKASSPQVLVATPGRLLKLIGLRAVNVSNVSFLVLYGLRDMIEKSSTDTVRDLISKIAGAPQTIILSDMYADASMLLAQNILKDPVIKVITDGPLSIQSACISQHVSVFVNEEKKTEKVLKILSQYGQKQLFHKFEKVVILVERADIVEVLMTSLQSNGYLVKSGISQPENKVEDIENNLDKCRLQIIVTTESLIDQNAISEAEIVIGYNFLSSIQTYCKILTGMARHSINGVLHSFLCGKDALMASPLINVLKQCSQPIPKSLEMMADAASVIHKYE